MKKSELPKKYCQIYKLPFTLRKNWKAVWDEVGYYSECCWCTLKSNK
ncbi:MAG: DUF2256 domain-containing protein [Paracoccaceae bacterium]|nr:DUF2256 domain-containing protein [Paracoccaceae bacterium]